MISIWETLQQITINTIITLQVFKYLKTSNKQLCTNIILISIWETLQQITINTIMTLQVFKYLNKWNKQLCTNIILISILGTWKLSGEEEKSSILPRWGQQPGCRRQPPHKSRLRLPSVRTWGRCLFLVGGERAVGSIVRWVLKALETITRLLLHFWYCEIK